MSTHDRLSPGVARLAAGGDQTDSTRVRIVPIPEGETTTGLSGTPTYWDRDVLESAVESGVFQGAKLLKSPGGPGHKEMEALADPDNIIGGVQSAQYEAGTGPVLEADLLDDHVADLVDNQLVGVSPDLYRQLGEYDEDREAYPAEEIVDVPYITVLDVGASEDATIEPANAEALAESDAGQYLQETDPDPDPDPDPDSPGRDDPDPDDDSDPPEGWPEQLGRLYTLRFRGYGDFVGEEFVSEAEAALDSIAGVTAVRSSDTEDPEIVAVLDREGLNMDGLNGAIISALDETPFEVFDDFDWVERANADQFADVGETVEAAGRPIGGGSGSPSGSGSGSGSDDGQASDEGAEADSSTGDDSSTDMGEDTETEPTKAELREQLAAAKAERNQAQERADTLEEKTDDLESEVEDKEEEIETKEEAIEEKESTVDELEDEVQNYRETLAGMVAEGSPLTAEDLLDLGMDSETLEQRLVESRDLDEDDDRSPREIVSEQMAQAPALRGGSEGEEETTPGGSGEPSDERLAAANDWAYEALSGSDIQRVSSQEQLSPRSLAEEKTGVDPAECDSRAEFERRVAAAADGGED